MYQKWIQIIEEHQYFDRSKTNYNVCIKHFQTDDLEIRGERTTLKKEAVPSIFEIYVLDDGDDCSELNASCLIPANQDIATLDKQMQCLTINHDIEIQKLSMKIKSLQDKIEHLQEISKHEKKTIEELEKKLSHEKRHNEYLELEIAQLKHEKNVSNRIYVCNIVIYGFLLFTILFKSVCPLVSQLAYSLMEFLQKKCYSRWRSVLQLVFFL